MSETAAVTPDEGDIAPDGQHRVAAVTPEPTPETPDLGDAGKKALDAERKRANAAEKQARELAAKVQAFEDASKTESEKAAARAEPAEKALAEMTAAKVRLEVAAELKVPDALRKFLTASDEDAIREQATDLLTQFEAAMAESGAPRLPKPDPSQGAKPNSGPDLDRQIAEALAAGDIAKSISLKRQKAYAPTT